MRSLWFLVVFFAAIDVHAHTRDSVVLTYWGKWTLDEGVDGLERAKALGAGAVTVLVHLCQDTPESNDVRFCDDASALPFVAGHQGTRLSALLHEAARRDLHVNLMPFLMIESGGGRHWIWPSDRARWFRTYGDRLVELAQYSQAVGLDRFIAGSELTSMYLFHDAWRSVIARVRDVFSGHVTVSAMVGTHPTILFWDALDSIGISAYFPLAPTAGMRHQKVLEAAWRAHLAHLLAFALAWQRPLMFVELGYPNTEVAAQRPWDWDFAAHRTDEDLQRRCFEAFRRVFGNSTRLWAVQLWGLSNPTIDGSQPKNFSPMGKAAEPVVRRIFAQRRTLP